MEKIYKWGGKWWYEKGYNFYDTIIYYTPLYNIVYGNKMVVVFLYDVFWTEQDITSRNVLYILFTTVKTFRLKFDTISWGSGLKKGELFNIGIYFFRKLEFVGKHFFLFTRAELNSNGLVKKNFCFFL